MFMTRAFVTRWTASTAVVLAAAIVIAATTGALALRNRFPQFPALRIDVAEVARDVALLDQAAAAAGFAVKTADRRFTNSNRPQTSLRRYESAGRCCFALALSRWDNDPVLDIWVSDSGRSEQPFDPADCAMYERFRNEVFRMFPRPHIFYERVVCAKDLPVD